MSAAQVTTTIPVPQSRNDQNASINGNTSEQSTEVQSKRIGVMNVLFGECLCTEAFRVRDHTGISPFAASKSQFLELDGIECIALGAVAAELTAEQRVRETIRQLCTNTNRLISLGYLADRPDGSSAEIDVTNTKHQSNNSKVAESIPLEIYAKTYSGDLEKTLSKQLQSIIVLLEKKKFEAALQELDKIHLYQKSHVRTKGDDNHLLAGITLHSMAIVNLLAGNTETAMPLFKEAVVIKRAAFGPNHPQVAKTFNEIGIQLFAKQMYKEALQVFNDARKIRVQSLGSSHPKVGMVMNNIACVHFQLKEPLSALTMLQEARDIQHLAMGSSAMAQLDLLHVATTLCNLGYLKLRLKNYEEAASVFEEALLVQQSVLDDRHTTIEDTLSNISFANAFHS